MRKCILIEKDKLKAKGILKVDVIWKFIWRFGLGTLGRSYLDFDRRFRSARDNNWTWTANYWKFTFRVNI